MMKRIIKYICLSLLTMSTYSCLIDDEAPSDEFANGPNLIGFDNASDNLTVVSNGDIYDFDIPLAVVGPSKFDIDEEVNAVITVDPKSTAIEGTHYKINDSSVSFKQKNDLKSTLPIQILTDGIVAPLSEAPVLILNISDVNGVDNLVINGRSEKTTIRLSYVTKENLTGRYKVIESSYWRIGVAQDPWDDEIRVIESLDETTYKHVEYAGPFDGGNDFYFTVNNNVVEVLTTNPSNGASVNLNDQPTMTCNSGNAQFDNATCDPTKTNFVERSTDRKDKITITYGYLSPNGPREFFEVLQRME